MKRIYRLISLIFALILCVCAALTGCGNKQKAPSATFMADKDKPPEVTPAYQQYTEQALADYFAVAAKHTVDGDIDTENAEVIAAAKIAAAKLFAYACYNERLLDKYVFFADQTGETTLSTGSGIALRQEFYLRVNQAENTCGYRYHYTIKKVTESSGSLTAVKKLFEQARIRITDQTNLLYRFEGDDIVVGDYNEALDTRLLTCDWKPGKDWGTPDFECVKGDFIPPEKIAQDIVEHAGEDNITIRANINILAENILKTAVIVPTEGDSGATDGYLVVMAIDTDVANADQASLKMLRKANGSDNCVWVSDGDESGLIIVFRIWSNGLFRQYTVSERWSGKISGFSGSADSSTTYYYSYSDSDCNMQPYLEMIKKAEERGLD